MRDTEFPLEGMGSSREGRKVKSLRGDSNVKIARGSIIGHLIRKVEQRRLEIAKLGGNESFG